MRRRILVYLVVGTALAFAVSGSLTGAQRKSESEVIGVAVTIPPLADFVEQVGAGHVRVTVMVPPGANPHTWEPTPRQLVELNRARLYVKVGSGLEFELVWVDKLLEMNKDIAVVDTSKGIQLFKMVHEDTTEAKKGNPRLPEEHGAEHHDKGYDPHIWLSPRNVTIMVENIYHALVSIDPTHQAEYTVNKALYLGKLDELDRSIRGHLKEVNNGKFMVFHPSWGYFARDYGLKQIPIEIEGKEPSPRDLIQLVEQAKKLNIKVIFVSPQFSTKSAEVIAREIGGRTVFVDSLAQNYIENMYAVARELLRVME